MALRRGHTSLITTQHHRQTLTRTQTALICGVDTESCGRFCHSKRIKDATKRPASLCEERLSTLKVTTQKKLCDEEHLQGRNTFELRAKQHRSADLDTGSNCTQTWLLINRFGNTVGLKVKGVDLVPSSGKRVYCKHFLFCFFTLLRAMLCVLLQMDQLFIQIEMLWTTKHCSSIFNWFLSHY